VSVSASFIVETTARLSVRVCIQSLDEFFKFRSCITPDFACCAKPLSSVSLKNGSMCIRLGNINPLNAELNPTCHLLALLGAHHILHVSRVRVKITQVSLISTMNI